MRRAAIFSAALALQLIAATALAETAPGLGERLREAIAGLNGAAGSGEILEPDRAFVLSSEVLAPDRVRLTWEIAPGYYLYRDKFSFAGQGLELGEPQIPRGEIEQDPNFGSVEIVRGQVEVGLPISGVGAHADTALEVTYQGCKEETVCYPPIKKIIPLALGALVAPVQAGTDAGEAPRAAEDRILHSLKSGGFWLNVATFFGFGLLLAFTPCVFPMVPILSGIIIGQGRQISTIYAFLLSLAYVLAVAATYAVLGVIAGSFNFNLQAAAQNTWVLTAFSAVFVLLALSMFGFYELQLPAALRDRLVALSATQRGGTVTGAALMGAFSAVIVGPCVAPPLAGALLYISQTGNATLGGIALFAMGLGFGVPLLVVGTSAGKLLPKADAWMETVKRAFGVIMLGVAIWFLERVLPGPASLALWALLFIVTAVYMGALDTLAPGARWPRLWRGLGLAVLAWGILLVIGAAAGGRDVLQPLRGTSLLAGNAVMTAQLDFKPVKSVGELREALLEASLSGRPVMLDFYADWCVICAELEDYTFSDPAVYQALGDFMLLKADVTANDAQDRELLRKFDLFGPPAILFFGTDAREQREHRLLGFIDPGDFVNHIRQVRQAGERTAAGL
jgi:thiol:disulfide interchange protein DsbD